MPPECPECVRLWHEYVAATVTQLKLETRLRVVALEGDAERVRAMRARIGDASRSHQELRLAMNEHRETAHAARGE
jgi:hypothetical protein